MDTKESMQDLATNTKARFRPNLFQTLSAVSEKNIWGSMFDFLKAAVSEVGEDISFYTMNFAEVLWKCQLWRKELPDVQMFYAIKANPDSTLLRFLVLLGCHFDCATEGEIRSALSAGARPDKIVFANPNVTTAGLKYTKKVGVDLMTFDSEGPLRRIFRTYPTARLLLRICPRDTESVFDFSEKYGCRLENASHVLTIAKGLGMDVVGVSFHVGSLNTCKAAFASAVRSARQIFDTARALGFRFSILDIGGGFQGSVGTDDNFCATAQSIRQALADNFPKDTTRFIAEPGCYVVCSAVSLTTTVCSKRTILEYTDDGKPPTLKRCYFLNNGIYSSFANGIEEYGIQHRPLLRKMDLLERPLVLSSLYGQTLCPRDVLRRDILFPEMEVAESVIWSNMGAYSQSMCSKFCGFPLPESRYVFRKDSRLRIDWIKNVDEVSRFLADSAYPIEEEKLPSNENGFH